jgi:hypothetical protein
MKRGATEWQSVEFTNLSGDTVIDSNGNYVSGSILEYVDMTGGGKSKNAELTFDVTDIFIDNCKINNSASKGIYLSNPSIKNIINSPYAVNISQSIFYAIGV